MSVRELSTTEAAAELRTDRNRVAKLIRQGHLRARRKYPQGRVWVVTDQAIADYRRACERSAA